MLQNLKVVSSEDGVPTLSFEDDAHLSWFRGYRFQVSGTVDGIGSYGYSTSTLQHDLRIASENGMDDESKRLLKQMVTLSHVFESSSNYPQLWELFCKDASLLNELISRTTDEVDLFLEGENFDFNKLISLVEVAGDMVDVPYLAKYDVSSTYKEGSNAVLQVMAGLDYLALQNVDTGVWYYVNWKELFKVDFNNRQKALLSWRFLYVLQCASKINIGTDKVTYLNGDSLEGHSSLGSEVVPPRMIYNALDKLYSNMNK